ncbi:hypothetical protein [Hymenobacter norwichensis]|uniref:hypothetical protein n=1 Tax=Hymenobacter norwichensis TaxID=223903 RepID=UPI0012FBFF60|nr:hypothetical protein [Hymenobacter norwichensis]
MPRLLLPFIAILFIGLLSGCAAIIPQTLMTPTVREKGEAEIDASVGLHGESLQAAYATSNHTVLLASGHHWARGSRWSWSGEGGGGRQWVRPNGGSWGLYGGAGYGAGYSYDSFCLDLCGDTPTNERVRYTYSFVQPTYTILQDRTTLGFAVRLQPLRLSRWETYEVSYSPDSLGNINREAYPINRAGLWMVLLQPGINVRYQIGKHLCLTYNISGVFPLSNRRREEASALRLATGVGVQLVLGRRAMATPAW